MKITKNPDKYDMNLYLKEKVLKECYTCPFCGEMRSYKPFHVEDGKLAEPYGVYDANVYHNVKVNVGLLKRKNMKVKHFECMTCGAKWESDPYDDTGEKPEFKVELIPVIYITLYLLSFILATHI